MVQAALLHDTVEDTQRETLDIETAFGKEVAQLVDACTKVAVVHPDAASAQRNAANLRKLFVSLAADPRVIVIKLCDRLHNLRTIGALPPEKARRIGEESLAVHAPLAHRMGLGALKAELEDRAFAAADPAEWHNTAARIAASGLHHRLEQARGELVAHLTSSGLEGDVSGRVKHLWSVCRKSQRHAVDPLELPDLLGLRVVCADIDACYSTLAAVHTLWEPDLSRLRDYINRPKSNGYQSLHTTVDTPSGRLEVQVRTDAMHAAAEHGSAAHHSYKHPGNEPRWVERLVAWAGEDLSDEEYLEGVHSELGTRQEILVLTPRGEIIELPAGATVIDFAYAIHSEVGDRCIGSLIDGRIAALDTPLLSGQRIEILTGQRKGPALEWLDWAVTSRARSRIRAHHVRLRGDIPTDSPTPIATPPVSLPVPRTRDTATLVPAVVGLDGVVSRLGGCCHPAPPAHLAGLVSRGRVTVHRSGCSVVESILAADPGRRCSAYWVRPQQSLLELIVGGGERAGLRAEIAAAVAGASATLLSIDTCDDGTLRVVVAVTQGRGRDLRSALRLVHGVSTVR
jgi:GTP pyrophosphokinase